MSDFFFDYSRWMQLTANQIGHKTLRQLVIPGAHDAATSAIHAESPIGPDAPSWLSNIPGGIAGNVISQWSKAQNQPIADQLVAGIRYLDLRVAKHDAHGQLYFIHTMLGSQVTPELQSVAGYLRGRDREIIILDFQHLINMSPADHNSLVKQITTFFGDKLIPPSEGPHSNLRQLWASGKQVVVFYGDDHLGTGLPKSFWPRQLLRSKWCDTMELDNLRNCLSAELVNPPKDSLFLLQCVLSPTTAAIVKSAAPSFIHGPRSLRDLASTANASVVSWCESDWKAKGLNILMFDWYEYGDVVKAAVRLNLFDGNRPNDNTHVDGTNTVSSTFDGNGPDADSEPTIAKVTVTFVTHDDDKDHDTKVSVILRNRKSMFMSQDIARLDKFAGNDKFPDKPPSTKPFVLTLVSSGVKISEIVLPVYEIEIEPVGNDRWIFDVTFTIEMTDNTPYSNTKTGIVLDQNNRRYSGVFGA